MFISQIVLQYLQSVIVFYRVNTTVGQHEISGAFVSLSGEKYLKYNTQYNTQYDLFLQIQEIFSHLKLWLR